MARGTRPSNIATVKQKRTRKSVDDDFAPSLTPGSPYTPSPKLQKYQPPKDPTWRPRRSTGGSSHPQSPALRRLPRRTSDPTYRPPRNLSDTDELTAATDYLRMRTRSGRVTKPGLKHRPQKRSPDTIDKLLQRAQSSSPKGHVHFNTDSLKGSRRGGRNFMTLSDLQQQQSPRSPRDRRPSSNHRISTRAGSQDLVLKPASKELSRRDSLERIHGPGRRLGSFGSQVGRKSSTMAVHGSATGKRRSTSIDAASAKRPRTSPTTTDADVQYDRCKQLLHQYEGFPQTVPLASISPLFQYVQTSIYAFSQNHFSFTLSEEERIHWPLHRLSTTYLPLMLTTQYIADGSQYGWRSFFTNSASRAALVSGIIGEWMKHRVFDHTCFGMKPAQLEKLEDIDREYLHHDGFLRTKKRAESFEDILIHDEGATQGHETLMHLHDACNDLAEELMQVFTPLLPPRIFFYSESSRDFHLDTSSAEAINARVKIKMDLVDVIKQGAALHRSIRMTGRDGTIVRIAPAVQKGERYYETAPFVIVNQNMVDATKHHRQKEGSKEEGKLLIKMTCFGRVEAYVPHGPDYEELVEWEEKICDEDQRNCGEDLFDWNEHESRVWPELPEDIVAMEARERGEKVEEGEKKYGSYVTYYPRLAPHMVYCEWMTPMEEKRVEIVDGEDVELSDDDDENGEEEEEARRSSWAEKRADRQYGTPLPKSQRVGLKEAVVQARKEKSPVKHWMEDATKEWWNAVCRHEGKLETGAVAIALASLVLNRRYGVRASDVLDTMRVLGTGEGWKSIMQCLRGKYDGLKSWGVAMEEGIVERAYEFMGRVKDVRDKEQEIREKAMVDAKRQKSIMGVTATATTIGGVVPNR